MRSILEIEDMNPNVLTLSVLNIRCPYALISLMDTNRCNKFSSWPKHPGKFLLLLAIVYKFHTLLYFVIQDSDSLLKDDGN